MCDNQLHPQKFPVGDPAHVPDPFRHSGLVKGLAMPRLGGGGGGGGGGRHNLHV